MAAEEGVSARNGGDGSPCHCLDPGQLRRIIRETLLPELREAILPELIQTLRDGLLPELRDVILRGMEETQNVPSGCTLSTVRIPGNQNQASLGHFQLHFNNKLPETIFTGNTVESKGNSPVQIFITDTDSKKITSGPLSKIKVEIVVLYGDFGDEKLGTWTEEEFSKHVVREREGRGPLLKGNRVITLKGGIGSLGSISFTDNSKWTRTQKFRLGAKALQNDLVEERIQEAMSEAFYVNDHRGEYTMKHDTPSPEDEVWRLKNIRKDGPYHQRLKSHGIITVQDFLKALVIDQAKLCRILFGEKIAHKKWNAIVHHAQKCNLGHKCYSYTVAEQQTTLVFDSIFQVIGAGFGDCTWQPLDQLSATQQNLVYKLKRIAYDNQNDMNELPANTLSGHPSDLLATYTQEPNSLCLHNGNVQFSPEGYRTGAVGDALHSPVPDYIEGLNHVEGQRQACFTMNSYKRDGISDLIQSSHEAYETDALVDSWHPSVLVCPEGSNHVETQQQACLDMNISKMDGVSDLMQIPPEGPACIEDSSPVEGQQLASVTTKSCTMHGMFAQEVYGTGSNSNNIMRQRSLREHPMIHTPRSKSIKKSVSARRSARIQQIKWLKLLVAVRFGVFVKLRAEAKLIDCYLLPGDQIENPPDTIQF